MLPLHDLRLPLTNNAAERQLRHYVLARRISYGTPAAPKSARAAWPCWPASSTPAACAEPAPPTCSPAPSMPPAWDYPRPPCHRSRLTCLPRVLPLGRCEGGGSKRLRTIRPCGVCVAMPRCTASATCRRSSFSTRRPSHCGWHYFTGGSSAVANQPVIAALY